MVTGYMPLLSYLTVATACRQDRKLGVYIHFENPIWTLESVRLYSVASQPYRIASVLTQFRLSGGICFEPPLTIPPPTPPYIPIPQKHFLNRWFLFVAFSTPLPPPTPHSSHIYYKGSLTLFYTFFFLNCISVYFFFTSAPSSFPSFSKLLFLT